MLIILSTSINTLFEVAAVKPVRLTKKDRYNVKCSRGCKAPSLECVGRHAADDVTSRLIVYSFYDKVFSGQQTYGANN